MEYMDEFTKTNTLSNCFLLLMKLYAAEGDEEIDRVLPGEESVKTGVKEQITVKSNKDG